MRNRLLILVVLGIIGVTSMIPCCDVKANYKVEYSTNSGSVEMSVIGEGRHSVTLKVTNKSKRMIRDVGVSSKGIERVLLWESEKSIGDIDSKGYKTVNVYFIKTGKSSLVNAINDYGGVKRCIPIGFYIVAGIVFGVYLFKKRKSCVEVAVVLVFVGGLVGVAQDQYPLKVGRVHTEIKSENGWCGAISFTAPVVEVNTSSEEVDIPFEIINKLDNTVKVTDEPIISEKGTLGKKLVTTTETIVDGKLESKKSAESILSSPQAQIQTQGTVEVVKKDIIPAKRVYVPNDTMVYGEVEKNVDLSGLQDKTGVQVTTYFWDEEKSKIATKVVVEKEPSIEYWDAGTLQVEEQTSSAGTEYINIDTKEVGYTHVVREERKGSKKNFYKVSINPETGKEIKSKGRKFVKTEVVKPVPGKVEVGTLEKVVKEYSYKVRERQVDKYFDSYRKVVKKGKPRKVLYEVVHELNKDTGEVLLDSTVSAKESKVLQKGNDEIVEVGSVTPNWVSFIDLHSEIKYNTVYVPCEDGSVVGNEQKIIQKGKNGRVYSEYLIACDLDGNELSSYEPKLIQKDKVVEPIEEKIMVASNSSKIKQEKYVFSITPISRRKSRMADAIGYGAEAFFALVLGWLSYKMRKKCGYDEKRDVGSDNTGSRED